jgi:hypothetical protein
MNKAKNQAAALAPLDPPPKPVPPQACSGEESKRRMAECNAKPFDLGLLATAPWHGLGGSAGFSWNGQPIRRR